MPGTIAHNTLYLSLSSTLALGISFVFNIFLARIFGVDQFGEFSFVMSFIGLFSVLVEFSLDSVTIRDVARNPTKGAQFFGNTLALKSVLFLVATVLITVTSHLLSYPPQVRVLLYILSLGLLFDGAKRCCVTMFEAAQTMQSPAVLVLMERVLFVALGLLVVTIYGSVIAIVVSYVAVQAITCLAAYFLVRGKLRLKAEGIEYNLCKRLARYALPFFATSLTAALYADIDKLFLFSIQSASSLGIYAATYKLVAIPIQFSNAFHRALYPVLSKHAAASDRALLANTYERSIRYLAFGAVPIGIGMTVFAEPILRATYGQDYVGGTIALQILVWAYVLEFFNPFFSRVLFAIGKERLVLSAVVSGTACNIIFNIILIPTYSLVGAAVATFLSATLIFLILSLAVISVFPNVSLAGLLIKPGIAGLCMWLFCTLLTDMWPLPLAVGSAVVYLGCLFLTRSFSADEILALRRALRVGTG